MEVSGTVRGREIAVDGERRDAAETARRGEVAVGKRLMFELRNGRKRSSLSMVERRCLQAAVEAEIAEGR